MGRYRFVPPSKEEQEKPVVLAPAKVSAESDKNSKKGARVPTGKSDRERMGQADDEPFVLNLPNMIRYLLIAGIAIAIGLFLGGQFMAIRKGAEKN